MTPQERPVPAPFTREEIERHVEAWYDGRINGHMFAPSAAAMIGQLLDDQRPVPADALIAVTASLAAAISLLECGGKKAAASDKMFAMMLNDYRKSLEAGRAALSRPIERQQDALLAALRKHAIIKTGDFRGRLYRCNECVTAWTPDDGECHQTGCLAALASPVSQQEGGK